MNNKNYDMEKINKLIDNLPEIYQSIYLDNQLIREGVRKNDLERLDVIKSYIKPGQTILDVGSNVGFFTIQLAKAFPENVFVSIEKNPSYAKLQLELLKQEKLENVILINSECSIDWLKKASLACTYFDVTLLLSVLHHMENASQFLEEVSKISKSLIIEMPNPKESKVCGKDVLKTQLNLEQLTYIKPSFKKLDYESSTHCDPNLKRSFYYLDSINYERECLFPYIGYPLSPRKYTLKIVNGELTLCKAHLKQEINLIPGVLLYDIAQVGRLLFPEIETLQNQIEQELGIIDEIDNVADIRPWNILFGARGLKFIDYKYTSDLESGLRYNKARDKTLITTYLEEIFIQLKKPIIIIDGVFFQLYNTGIARVWKSLLEDWARDSFSKHILVLDRAGTAPKIPGIRYRVLPRYNPSLTEINHDLLQQVCDEEAADLFISTYYTTPRSTPSVFMAYDMIPEILEWGLDHPTWQQKHDAIRHASAYISISENTARDLVKFFPEVSLKSVVVALCGTQSSFSPATIEEINTFRAKYGISRPYFIIVGAGGYKNTILFLKAFAELYSKQGFSIVCTGSGGLFNEEYRNYTSSSVVHMLQLSDADLRVAYSGAVALVYPSIYEGFGLPVLEAMACGCPVITCPNASLPEVAGEAALYVDDADVNEMANALCDIQKPIVRNVLIAAGLEQAKKFSWSKMARQVSSALVDATLLPLKLRDINLIIFPDWTQPEEYLAIELERVIKAIATHPDASKMTLLIEAGSLSEEEANLVLSGVVMNLLMQEDLDVTEEAEISLVGKLGEIQWEALFPRLQARIVLDNENQQAIAFLKADTLPPFELDNFSNQRFQPPNRLNQVIGTLEEQIRLNPTDPSLHFSLIINLQTKRQTQEAISRAEGAANLFPDDYTFKLLKNLIVPIIYDTQDEIDFYRQRFINGLQDLIQHTSLETTEEKKQALEGIGRFTNFYLSYQAQNDRDLQCQYGNLVHKIMGANYPQWIAPVVMPPLKENKKIRIGFVSAYLYSYSGTLWLTGWLRYVDKQSFEIHCYYTGEISDAITQKFQEYSEAFHHIPHNLEALCEQIMADQLHILIYPEIGMNAPTMRTAGLRLAPIQCTAWGHPVTSGLPTIDYFLSSELMEPENDQDHYSETLIRLPNIGVSYPKPYIPSQIKSRSDYQLRDDAVLYLCCQAPCKYLPQYDFIFAEIAQRVPQAQFVFLRGELLQPRLSRAFAAVGLRSEDFCVFLTIPERLDYLMINLLSDIYLDTFSWSGGNTSLEAISCNLPIVTCPGEFMRGRHSESFLKMLGVTDTIAQNEEEYIEIAVKLALDPAWRRNIAQQMSESHDRLYDDKACVAGLEAFCKQVVQERLTQTN